MDSDSLKIVLNIVSVKRMKVGSLSSAVVEVKISGFVLKIRSLRGATCEFDEQKTEFKLILLNWSR